MLNNSPGRWRNIFYGAVAALMFLCTLSVFVFLPGSSIRPDLAEGLKRVAEAEKEAGASPRRLRHLFSELFGNLASFSLSVESGIGLKDYEVGFYYNMHCDKRLYVIAEYGGQKVEIIGDAEWGSQKNVIANSKVHEFGKLSADQKAWLSMIFLDARLQACARLESMLREFRDREFQRKFRMTLVNSSQLPGRFFRFPPRSMRFPGAAAPDACQRRVQKPCANRV